MSPLQAHFQERAAALHDCATLETSEREGATTLTLRPHVEGAVGVELYLFQDAIGTVRFTDPASSSAELGEDPENELRTIDYFVDAAVAGRVTAFHRRGRPRGGLIEVVTADGVDTSWHNVLLPLPGWRKRADMRNFRPYR